MFSLCLIHLWISFDDPLKIEFGFCFNIWVLYWCIFCTNCFCNYGLQLPCTCVYVSSSPVTQTFLVIPQEPTGSSSFNAGTAYTKELFVAWSCDHFIWCNKFNKHVVVYLSNKKLCFGSFIYVYLWPWGLLLQSIIYIVIIMPTFLH